MIEVFRGLNGYARDGDGLGREMTVPGQLQDLRVKPNQVALSLQHDALEIVVEHRARHASQSIEALNNNWETLVRRGRGYRDLPRLLRLLRFIAANPIRTAIGIERFLALGATPPFPSLLAA